MRIGRNEISKKNKNIQKHDVDRRGRAARVNAFFIHTHLSLGSFLTIDFESRNKNVFKFITEIVVQLEIVNTSEEVHRWE